MTAREVLEARLAALRAAGLWRTPAPPRGIDLCSNDTLGFARDPVLAGRVAEAVRGLPAGAGAARLLGGELPAYAGAEAVLAAFSGRETATLFSSGYQANLALLSALLAPGDRVCSDALNHASLVDGARLCGAEKLIYPHADVAALRALFAARPPPRGLTVIATESLFGMDGDVAPLEELAALAEEVGALLVVDEAHATGLFGAGLVASMGLGDRVFATVHTGGKALGVAGAWIAGGRLMREALVNRARSFIFSTGPLPAVAAALEAAVERWREVGPGRAKVVLQRARRFRAALRCAGARVPDGAGAIVPLVLGDNESALRVAAALQARGFDARAVRPPTVPEGTARLRLTVTWPVDENALDEFVRVLKEVL